LRAFKQKKKVEEEDEEAEQGSSTEKNSEDHSKLDDIALELNADEVDALEHFLQEEEKEGDYS